MKNLYKYFLGLFLLIILFIKVEVAEAIVFAPVFNVTVITNTTESDAEFSYVLDSHTVGNPVSNDTQTFSILTASSTGNYQAGTPVASGDEVYLTQNTLSDWSTLEVYCVSPDPTVTSSPYSNDSGSGVKITAATRSSITCTFTNVKAVPKKNPVIIIPGILSSHLNRNDDEKTELWPNIVKALFGLPGDKYLDELALNEIGEPNLSNPVILPTDIFRKINNHDFFDGLVQKLKMSGYEEGKDLFIFPYDWRLDIRKVVAGLYSPILTSLKDRVDQILTETGSEKVDIIAHSMGGLLAKYYIEHYGAGKVDKFIDIATPHLGAPSAFKTLMWGDDMGIKFGFLGLNTSEVKKIVQNMPSAYQLLPSENYFSNSSPDYKYYVFDRSRLSFSSTTDYLKNAGRNEYVLDHSVDIHNDLDYMNPADYGVNAYNIVGCGVPTIAKFFNFGDDNYDVAYTSGDGTVPEKSSRSFPATEEYKVTNTKHSSLPSREGVSDLVSKVLNNSTSTFDYIAFEYISTSTPVCTLPDGEIMSFHGPVKLEHYEYASEMTYDYIEDNIFIFLPLLSEEKVKLVSTGSGHASAHIKKFRNNEVVSTSYFPDIPIISASTTLEIKLGDGESRINDLSPATTTPGDYLDEPELFVIPGDNIMATTSTSTVPEITVATTSTSTKIVEEIPSHRVKSHRLALIKNEEPEEVLPAQETLQEIIPVAEVSLNLKPEQKTESKIEIDQTTNLTPVEPLYYAAVSESNPENKKFYWRTIILAALVIFALAFSKKLIKRVK